ncbi:MAG: GNAT family N-acetyltransferase [Chloroflexota bacterium]
MSGRRPFEIRPAVESDLPTIREILAAHGNDGPVVITDVVGPYLRHLLRFGRARVAVEDDTIVAFGATIAAGPSVHLADLFVRPDRMGQGIGRPLLADAFGEAVRRTTFASDDPAALPIYVRAGMRAWWPNLYVEGSSERVPVPAATLSTREASAGELAAIEEAWSGHDRTADWAHWSAQTAGDSFVVLDGEDVVAIGSARVRQVSTLRVLNRLVVNPDPGVDPVPVTLTAIRRAGQGGEVVSAIQGPSPVLWPLLDLGFRIADRDQYMASEPDLVDPARLIPNPGML